jgi:hypothetical protein
MLLTLGSVGEHPYMHIFMYNGTLVCVQLANICGDLTIAISSSLEILQLLGCEEKRAKGDSPGAI